MGHRVCNESIYSFDLESETLTLRAEPEGEGVLDSPRVNNLGALAWLSLDDMCGEEGRLMFEHGDHLTEVAEVHTDIFCVGHLPIPMELTMNEK